MEYLVTLHTHFDAIQYMKFLKFKGISGKLQPVPRKLSSSCGTCAVFSTKLSVLHGGFLTDGCEAIFFILQNNHNKKYILIGGFKG